MDAYKKIKPVLFKMDPERANSLAEHYMKVAESLPFLLRPFVPKLHNDKSLESDAFGSVASSPIGMAAGFDKNARLINAAHMLGFGFTEIGTVTLEPQEGNDKPRMFRFPKDKSIQNMLGFNNDGAARISARLSGKAQFPLPVGISIGRGRSTPNENALEEYSRLASILGRHASYIAINLSSPNTQSLRELENTEFVLDVIKEVKRIAMKPVLLKISPDSIAKHIIEIGHAVSEAHGDGIIATNTSRDFTLLPGSNRHGGISGDALKRYSRNALKTLYNEFGQSVKIVSVGGIDSAEEVYARILNGASLVQLYTAMVFEGPGIVNRINTGLASLLRKDGYDKLADATGAMLRK